MPVGGIACQRHGNCCPLGVRADCDGWCANGGGQRPPAVIAIGVVVTRMTLLAEPLPFLDSRAEVEAVLAARARFAIRLVLLVLLVYAVADWVAHHHVVTALWLIAAGQVAALGCAAALLRGQPSRKRTVVVVLVTIAVVQWSGVLSDALSANPMATLFSAVGAAMATGALFPWGPLPQTVLALIVMVTGTLSFLFVPVDPGAAAYIGTMCSMLVGASVLVAHANEQVRCQRAAAEERLWATTQRAESEARIATVLAHASEVLAAHLDEPDMLDRLHAIAREALAVDWSAALILEPDSGNYRLVAAAFERPALRREALQMEFPASWLPMVKPEGTFELPDLRAAGPVRPLLERLSASSALGAPLWCRGHLLGVQMHGHHTRTGPFSAEAQRLAAGLAHATALAIENARRIVALEAASRLKTEFVATMSHELRTPLNVITGYTEMLADEVLGPLTPTQRDTLARLRRSADELLELVNATLDVGRLEAGRVAVERRAVDLGTLVAELDVELRPVLSPGVALRWHVDDVPRMVSTDRGKLKTIIKNVVGNACKFTPQGAVDVQVGWQTGELEIVVRDTGIGIPAEQLPHIFDMFRQGDGSATRRFNGVGLGLHIVRRFVDLLGGTIAVQSTVGTGTCFTIRLPTPMALVVAEASCATG